MVEVAASSKVCFPHIYIFCGVMLVSMIDRIRSCIVFYYFYLIYVCIYMIDYVLKKKKETKMFIHEFPGYKKQKILELKHFNIFVSEPLKKLFLLKFSNLLSKSFKNTIEIIQFLDRLLFWNPPTKLLEIPLKKSIFKAVSSESTNKILEKNLWRNLYFGKLFCIYERNLWYTLAKIGILLLGYICDCS